MKIPNLQILFLFILSIAIRIKSNIIKSPRITSRGNWGDWENCKQGTFGIGFQLKTEPKKGWIADESALNAIKILCGQPGSRHTESQISSLVGGFGHWGNVFYCDGLLTGFQLRSEKDAGDKTAANNLRGICSSTAGLPQVIEGDGLDFGSWTAEQHCSKDEAICGIQTQVELGSSFKGWIGVDDTGLNNVDMKCCKIHGDGSACKTSDAWEVVSNCNNLGGVSDLTCTYEKTVGISNTKHSKIGGDTSTTMERSASRGIGIDVAGLSKKFEQSLRVSKTTGHNWAKESSQTWNTEVKHSAQFTVPPQIRSTLYQVVGYCGDYAVHTASFKKIDSKH